jgi:hypothetical protein
MQMLKWDDTDCYFCLPFHQFLFHVLAPFFSWLSFFFFEFDFSGIQLSKTHPVEGSVAKLSRLKVIQKGRSLSSR